MQTAVAAALLAMLTLCFRVADFHPVLVFLTAGCTLIAVGDVMARANEEVAGHVGPVAGGLLNASFGNSTELAVGFLALHKGQIDVVKGATIGSILTNLLLILGLAALVGGVKFKYQTFQPRAASVTISTMTVAVIAFLLPAVLPKLNPEAARDFSLGVSVLLIFLYVMSLVFSLVTHAETEDVSAVTRSGRILIPTIPTWSLRKGMGVMLVLTALVLLVSDTLVDSIEGMMSSLKLSPSFLGVILLAAFGNAADLSVAIRLARKNRIDLVFQLVSGAATQVALWVGPLFVLAGFLMGQPMSLQFTMVQVVSVAVSTLIVGVSAGDGELDWFKGLLLLGVYSILGVANFFY